MNDNLKRIYALASWTVWQNGKGWFVRTTGSSEEWLGPYTTERRACLTIGRQPQKELLKRDRPRTVIVI